MPSENPVFMKTLAPRIASVLWFFPESLRRPNLLSLLPKMRTQPNKKTTGFDLQWLFAFSIVFGGFYLMTKPATNGKVLIFRLAVVAFGVVGLIVTTLVKRRQRAKAT